MLNWIRGKLFGVSSRAQYWATTSGKMMFDEKYDQFRENKELFDVWLLNHAKSLKSIADEKTIFDQAFRARELLWFHCERYAKYARFLSANSDEQRSLLSDSDLWPDGKYRDLEDALSAARTLYVSNHASFSCISFVLDDIEKELGIVITDSNKNLWVDITEILVADEKDPILIAVKNYILLGERPEFIREHAESASAEIATRKMGKTLAESEIEGGQAG